jgi:uncharacterized protein with FMN-binding domain
MGGAGMKKKVILCFASVLLVVAACGYLLVYVPTMKKHTEVRNMEIAEINLADIKDGSYRGEFSYVSFTYIVNVTVSGNRITGIQVVQNRDSSYAKKAEGVMANIIQAQSLQVDTVSGATTTSKALLKAVENALVQAQLR